MAKKILIVVAHPDDETFGFGGTIAKYAKEGVEIHVLCATRGESGQGKGDLAKIREQELLRASKILGVKKVEFLDFVDGTLCNNQYHEVAEKIKAKLEEFQPQVVLTFDQGGVSGHIDHIVMSMVTTFVVSRYFKKIKLFYLHDSKTATKIFSRFYYIFFPPGLAEKEADVVMDISDVWKLKVAAMKEHKSQIHDVNRILLVKRFLPKRELYTAFVPKKSPASRTDFFAY